MYLPVKDAQDAADLRQNKIRLLQALGKRREAAQYATSQIPAQDDQPRWERVHPNSTKDTSLYLTDDKGKLYACRDAAEAWLAAGEPDKACQIFADFVRACGPEDNMNEHSATIRIYLADYEAARGNLNEAAEILRAVARHAEGKNWGAYLRTGYANAYDACLSRLADLRSHADFSVVSTDWEHPPQSAQPSPAESSDLDRDLEALLRGTRTGPNQISYGGAQVDVFVRNYGHDAVPAILKASVRDSFHAQLLASFWILQRVVTPADRQPVLDAFKFAPALAPVAFQLDATNAAVILRERFGIYGRGGNIPPELLQVITRYKLKDQYRILVANFSAKEINGATAPDAAALARIFRNDTTSECLPLFQKALATTIEKQLLTSYRYGLASLGETAMGIGVPEGIEAVLHSDDNSTNCPASLRKFIDLPDDNAQARITVEAGLGRWQWDVNSRKFMLAPAARSTN
jgi:hypothetical protein